MARRLVIVPLPLERLFAHCAPNVGPLTMAAIVVYESGGRPFAIGDNTAHRSYFPDDGANAVRLGTALLAAGHNIDVGYAQINSGNFPRYGLSVGSALDPCTNVATGSRILRAAYASASRAYGSGQIALVHALSAYNTGGYWAGLGYARSVYATAAGLRSTHDSLRTAAEGGRAVPFTPARPHLSGERAR